MDRQVRHYYEFEPFRIDIDERTLLRGDNPVQVAPKVFDILLTLVESSGRILEKEELMRRVWADSFVEEGNLNRNISTLRRLLSDDPIKPKFIKTAPKRGYSFVGNVKEVWEDDEAVVVENRTRYHLKVSERNSAAPSNRKAGVYAAFALFTIAALVFAAWVWNRAGSSDSLASARANPEAAQLYRHGRDLWETRSGEKLHEATRSLEQAIALDPNFALAHAALADAYAFDYANWKKAEASANAALAIDPGLGEAHAAIGFVRMFWEWKLVEAEAEFKRALELNPGYATAHQWYAVLLAAVVRHDSALAEMKTALALAPNSLSINADLCQMLYIDGSYDEAIAQCRKTLERDRDFYNAHNYLYEIYSSKGMYDEAVAAHLELERITNNQSPAVEELRDAYARSGIRGFWQRRADMLSQAPVQHYGLARHMARLGKKEGALRHLTLASERREPDFLLFYRDPAFEQIRSDPRFDALIGRLFPTRD